MIKPDNEYRCLLGVYEPNSIEFHPNYRLSNNFTPFISTPSDPGGCIGSTNIISFNAPVKAILVARPFRSGGKVKCEHTVDGNDVVSEYSLYDSTLETPRLIWLPENVRRIAFNIRVEDMGYEPSWYNQQLPITESCDRDFINHLGLYFMFDASPYYSKLELSKDADSNAPYGRFLRDNVNTDLTFRATDFYRVALASEYAICAVVFYETFEQDSSMDYIAACCYFNKAESEVNFSEQYVKPVLKALDNYSWLLEKYSVEKNIVKIQAEAQRVSIPIPPLMQFYAYGDSKVTNVCLDHSWEQEVGNSELSVGELRKMGFMSFSFNKIPNTLVTDRALNIVLYYPYVAGGLIRYARIIYLLDIASGEYVYESTENYNDAPREEWPYDRFRFRWRNGRVQCYDSETGEIKASVVWGASQSAWPPAAGVDFPTDGGTFISEPRTLQGYYTAWKCQSANIDANIQLFARMLCHSSTQSDRYSIGDFATPSVWYNKLAYPIDLDPYHNVPWEGRVMFKQTDTLTPKPTEYGHYDPNSYYTNEYLQVDSYIQGLRPTPVFRSMWGNYSYWVDIVGSDTESLLKGFTDYVTVNDCYTLDSVIRRLLNAYGVSCDFTGTTDSSMLIYGDANHNPSFLKCRYPFIVPSTNITGGKYKQAAQKAMLSLKDLLDEICSMCNAGWHIDRNGLHIEGNEWYDHGHSYSGASYLPSFDFEDAVDEFNGTDILYGQIASQPNVSGMWHTLKMSSNDNATKHFSESEIVVKAAFCTSEKSENPKLSYDLLEAVAIDGSISDDGIIMLGSDVAYQAGNNTQLEAVRVYSTTIYDVSVGMVSQQSVQARIMNKAFSWPVVKGRYMLGLPADKYLTDFGWLDATEYYSTLQKAYTMPHRTIKIRMPVVSDIYTENWQLVKTTLGYGVIGKVDIDLITRVATITVDILEYNL